MTTTAVGLVQASQVVGGCGRARDWPDWEREFGQRPHRWVCRWGRSDVTPARSHCGDLPAAVSRADSWPMAWLPRPSATPAIFPWGYPHSDRHSKSLQAPIKVRFLIKDR